MIPTPVTKEVAGCEATCTPHAGYPDGAELFARVLSAAKPGVSALGALFDAVKAGIDPELFAAASAAASESDSFGPMLAAAAPALLKVDASPLLAAIPDIVRNIIADQALVADLLSLTTVIVDGKNHRLNSRKAIGAAVGYDYALLVGLVWFAIEVNFRGPFVGAFGGILPGARRRGEPAAAP